MGIKSQLILSLIGVVSVQSVLNNSTVVGTTDCKGYRLTSMSNSGQSWIGRLSLIGKPCNMFGADEKELSLKVSYDSNRLRVKIEASSSYNPTDSNSFQVPDNLFESRVPPSSSKSSLKFEYKSSPFSFKVIRKSDNSVLFDTYDQKLIYQHQYLELSSALPSNANIYGIGEVVDKFRRDPNTTVQAMWARDVADPVRENLYGTHPYYIELRDTKFHGVHLLNSYGMDVILTPSKVSYKTLGGVFDFSFIDGPDYKSVNEKFSNTFGHPARVNYWSLGFHQCRYGYKSIDEVSDVVKNFTLAKLPLETMWTDIEHMDKFMDFTYDPVNFPLTKLRSFVDGLHKKDQHYVLIIDPAIPRLPGYEAYDLGLKLDVFLKNPDGTPYVGQVWPGYTVFPDWFATNVQKYWDYLVTKFLSETAVDGLWIDMNEAASFCFGSCGSNRTGIPLFPWEDPNYKDDPQLFKEPNYAIHNFYGNLSQKTVATNAKHQNGLTQFQTHNLYGHMEAQVTRRSMLKYKPTTRPFLLSRSTFTGSGALAGHWTGDNFSGWNDLYYSIAGVMSFNMFGIPYVGADICGFNGDTTEELCLRWMQLGSLYPFSRNHNVKGAIPQEPYRWESVKLASRKALKVRYQLIPYIYSLFEQSARKGSMVWVPMAFKFNHEKDFADLDTQFMVGDAVMVAPVLKQGATEVAVKFPKGKWYDYYTHSEIEGGQTLNVKAGLKDEMPIFINGGNILPIKPFGEDKLTLKSQADLPLTLIVALDSKYQAKGSLYMDDGSSLNVGNNYADIKFSANKNSLRIEGFFGYKKLKINKIVWLGLPKGYAVNNNQIKVNTDGEEHKLVMDNLELTLDEPSIINL